MFIAFVNAQGLDEAYQPLLTCFEETEKDRVGLRRIEPTVSEEELPGIKAVTRHVFEGYFVTDLQGPKLVYRCRKCGARRVYGALVAGTRVEGVEAWSKLQDFETVEEGRDDNRTKPCN